MYVVLVFLLVSVCCVYVSLCCVYVSLCCVYVSLCCDTAQTKARVAEKQSSDKGDVCMSISSGLWMTGLLDSLVIFHCKKNVHRRIELLFS